jgi:drug/metabolite transporter (DMT)-like permease
VAVLGEGRGLGIAGMTRAAANLRGALLVVVAMAAFCINDAFIKDLSTRLPISELMAVRGVFAIALMLVVLPWLGLQVGRPERFTWLRAAGEVAVTFAFLAALARLPIGDTYTLYFAGPLLLTAGAALFLKERVGPRRWSAVVVGFLGVLVVLGLPSGWQLASLIALAAALLSVARDLTTRWIPASVGSGTVALLTSICVALSGAATVAGGGWVPIGWGDVGLCALAAFGVAAGYTSFVVALRTGELSFVATFRYAGIPMAMLLGFLVWGDVPGPRMLAGAVLIMGSGLYILLHERGRAGGG